MWNACFLLTKYFAVVSVSLSNAYSSHLAIASSEK